MAIFAISDLHLSFGSNKPMDVFGGNWINYEEKMLENWNNTVQDGDTVIVNGDISWAMYLNECEADFSYIEKLRGHKIIGKGNHDYWWTTIRKQENFVEENKFNSIKFLHNNAYVIDNIAICGTRGYLPANLCTSKEDQKIYNRELERFELSARQMRSECETKIAALHYPPDENFEELFHKYEITHCIFGHLHGKAHKTAKQGIFGGIQYNLVSCDYLDFTPLKIK